MCINTLQHLLPKTQLILQRIKENSKLPYQRNISRLGVTFLSAVGLFSFAISFSFPFLALEEVMSRELQDVKQGWLLVKGFLLAESLVWKAAAAATANKQEH